MCTKETSMYKPCLFCVNMAIIQPIHYIPKYGKLVQSNNYQTVVRENKEYSV